MPPRKSNASQPATTADEATPAKETGVGINIEDLNLPKSIVTRLAKGVLPPNTQIQQNAMLAMTKSATVFASYLASVANEHAQSSSRKTVSAEHVLAALSDLEFPEFRPRLEAELKKYQEVVSEKRRNQYKAKKEAGAAADGGSDEEDENGERASKKARLEGGVNGKGKERREKDADETESEEGVNDREDGHMDADADEEVVDDDVEDEEEEERLEVEEHEEREMQIEAEEREMEGDEALDNGEDSD